MATSVFVHMRLANWQLPHCARSCFNSLRKRAHWFINLLSVMLIAKLGELEGMEELDFVRKRFMLDLDDKQAADQ